MVTNAVKHAYADGRPGRLQVSAKSRGGRAEIVIEDDGPGFPLEDRSGLGRKLIGRLSKQAAAETLWLPANPGTRAVIAFEVED